jgi:hypothetical protein
MRRTLTYLKNFLEMTGKTGGMMLLMNLNLTLLLHHRRDLQALLLLLLHQRGLLRLLLEVMALGCLLRGNHHVL